MRLVVRGERFEGGELAREDAQLVDQPTFESAVAETLAQCDVVASPAGDLPGQAIANDVRASRLPIDE